MHKKLILAAVIGLAALGTGAGLAVAATSTPATHAIVIVKGSNVGLTSGCWLVDPAFPEWGWDCANGSRPPA